MQGSAKQLIDDVVDDLTEEFGDEVGPIGPTSR
jgi:hypothetical protein